MDPASSSQAPASPAAPYHRADWYPDPTGRFEFRYHNGQAWTGDVSVDGNRYLDPMSSGPAPQSVPMPMQVPVRTHGAGKAKASFILGLGAVVVGWIPFICVLAIAAAVLALVFGIGVIRRGRDAPGHGFAVAGVILAPFGLVAAGLGVWLSVVAIREVNEYTNVGRYDLAPQSCVVNDGAATSSGLITNKTATTKTYHIVVDFVRPDTNVAVYTGSTDVTRLRAGETAEWKVFMVVDEGELDCRVRDVTGPLPFDQGD